MVASMADQASQRPEIVTSQGLFQARAATGLSAVVQRWSLAFDQRLIKGVGHHVEKLGLKPCGEKREVVEVRVLL